MPDTLSVSVPQTIEQFCDAFQTAPLAPVTGAQCDAWADARYRAESTDIDLADADAERAKASGARMVSELRTALAERDELIADLIALLAKHPRATATARAHRAHNISKASK